MEKNWAELLNGFAGQLNAEHESIFSRYPTSYYWRCDQSEWTTDIVFREAGFLKRLMPLLVRHGVLSYSSTDVMRYFGKKVNLSGEIPAHFSGTLKTDLKRRREGDRVKFSLNANSAKFYDKAHSEIGSVLRGAETTIITVGDFRACRTKEGGGPGTQRKGQLILDKADHGICASGQEDLQWRRTQGHRRSAPADRSLAESQCPGQRGDSRSVEELTADISSRAAPAILGQLVSIAGSDPTAFQQVSPLTLCATWRGLSVCRVGTSADTVFRLRNMRPQKWGRGPQGCARHVSSGDFQSQPILPA